MRARAFILTLSLVLIGGVSFAGSGESAFRKKINKLIHYPLSLKKKVETTVYVEFTVNDKHEIIIDSIECPDPEVCAAIAEQIKKIEIDRNNIDIVNKTFYYKFKLEVEK